MSSDLVTTHLRVWAASDFAWGKSDCAIVLADYLLDVLGVDCAAHLRGRYADRSECMRLCGFHRGLTPVIEECVSGVPLARTEIPVRGDIGIIGAAEKEFGAICLGRRWAVKSIDGVLFFDQPRVVAAWAVPKG